MRLSLIIRRVHGKSELSCCIPYASSKTVAETGTGFSLPDHPPRVSFPSLSLSHSLNAVKRLNIVNSQRVIDMAKKRERVWCTLPQNVLDLIDKLIEKGDYRNRSDFLLEASRSHLRTWYPKEFEES